MHPASMSIKAFGIYATITGIGLFLAPNLVLAPLGVPATTEIWIRAVGAIAIIMGYYYWACGAADAIAFFKATVKGRFLYAALSIVLVMVFQAPLQLLLFAAIDIAGALWTWQGLRAVETR